MRRSADLTRGLSALLYLLYVPGGRMTLDWRVDGGGEAVYLTIYCVRCTVYVYVYMLDYTCPPDGFVSNMRNWNTELPHPYIVLFFPVSLRFEVATSTNNSGVHYPSLRVPASPTVFQVRTRGVPQAATLTVSAKATATVGTFICLVHIISITTTIPTDSNYTLCWDMCVNGGCRTPQLQ